MTRLLTAFLWAVMAAALVLGVVFWAAWTAISKLLEIGFS